MEGFNGADLPKLSIDTSVIQNSALHPQNTMSRIEESLRVQAEYNARKDAALFETAEASVAQKELLEEQLVAVKEQNRLLQMNYDTLKELYDNTKSEAAENKADAKRSRIFGWVTFGNGTLIGAAGLVVAIIALAVS